VDATSNILLLSVCERCMFSHFIIAFYLALSLSLIWMPFLFHWTAGNNSLIGSIPTELGRLTAVEVLDLRTYLFHSSLTVIILVKLQKRIGEEPCADCVSFGISFSLDPLLLFPVCFNKCIRTILLYKTKVMNQLTGSLPSELGAMTAMRSMFIDNNKLVGPLPSEIGKMAGMTELYLSTLRRSLG
jgi:hypothetical protein